MPRRGPRTWPRPAAWTSVGLAVLLALLAADPAAAAELYARPRLGQQLGYDNNVGFNSGNDNVSTFRETTNPGVLLGARSRRLDLSLDARAEIIRFPDEQALDSNDTFLTFNGRWQGQTTEAKLNARFDRDTSRNDDFNEDGRFLLDNRRRQTLALNPSLIFTLSQRHQLQLAGGYRYRFYPTIEDGRGDGLFEGQAVTTPLGVVSGDGGLFRQSPNRFQSFSQFSGGATWITQLTARTSAGGGPSVLAYESNRQDVQQLALQGFLAHTVSPRLKLDLKAGPSATRSQITSLRTSRESLGFIDVDPGPDEDLLPVTRTTFSKLDEADVSLGYVADAGLEWQATRRTDAKLRYTHAVEPFGSGQAAVTRDTLRVNLDHDLQRNVRLFATTTGQIETSVGNEDTTGDRYVASFEPGVRWAIKPDIDLSLRYRWRYQRIDSASGGDYIDTASNAVFVRVDLRLPELRGSW